MGTAIEHMCQTGWSCHL